MARLVLLLISLCWLACSTKRTNEVTLNRAEVPVKTVKGTCYINGSPFSGILVTTGSGGDTLAIEQYDAGREHGLWKQFYGQGKRKSVRRYTQGKKQGIYTEWWPNGKQKFEYHFIDGEYEGTLKEWDETGVLLKESTYRAGYEDGPQKAWYPNGKTRSNYVVKNGRRFGLLGTKNCVNVADSVFNNL